MKKIISIFVIVMIVATMFAGCGAKKEAAVKKNGSVNGSIEQNVLEENVLHETILYEDIIYENVITESID